MYAHTRSYFCCSLHNNKWPDFCLIIEQMGLKMVRHNRIIIGLKEVVLYLFSSSAIKLCLCVCGEYCERLKVFYITGTPLLIFFTQW